MLANQFYLFLKEFEFLTGVNIQGADQDSPGRDEDNEAPDSNGAKGDEGYNGQQKYLDSKRYKIMSDELIDDQNKELETLRLVVKLFSSFIISKYRRNNPTCQL